MNNEDDENDENDEDPVPPCGELHELPKSLSNWTISRWWDYPRAMCSYIQHLFLHDGAARGGLRVSLEGLFSRDLGAASSAGGCRL